MNLKSAPLDRATAGPLDSSELNHAAPYLDLGAIRVPAIDSIAVKLEVEEATGKPIAVTLAEADDLIALARRNQRVLQVG